MPRAAKKHNEIFDPPDTPVDSAMNSTNPSSPANSSGVAQFPSRIPSLTAISLIGRTQRQAKKNALERAVWLPAGSQKRAASPTESDNKRGAKRTRKANGKKPKRGKKNKKKGPGDSNAPTESDDSATLSESDPLADELPGTKQNTSALATDPASMMGKFTNRTPRAIDYEPGNTASAEEGELDNPSETDDKASQDEDTENDTAEESPESDIDEVVRKERSALEMPVWTKKTQSLHPAASAPSARSTDDADAILTSTTNFTNHSSQKPITSCTAKPSAREDSAHKSRIPGVIVLSSSDEGPAAEKPSRTKGKEKMRTTSALSKRKEKATLETPSWKSNTTHNESPSNNRPKPRPATQKRNVSISSALGTLTVKTEPSESRLTNTSTVGRWPEVTNLVLPPPTAPDKRLRLLQQTDVIQEIVRNAIDEYSINILTINAFPDGISKTTLLTTALYRGAETLRAAEVAGSVEAVGAGDVLARLQADRAYRSALASLPDNRIGDIRKGFKKAAETLVMEHYGFGKEGVDTVPIVQNLLYNDTYIYPGNNAQRQVKSGLPYTHHCVIAFLHDKFFDGAASFVKSHLQLFNKDGAAAIPAPMVALAAASISIAIVQWASGRYVSVGDFTAEVVSNIYHDHIATLGDLAENDNHYYQKLMQKIYILAMGGVKPKPKKQIVKIDIASLIQAFAEEEG
ncbi:hypothetical protein BOTBODRAFT_181603 [Botryobasidium botryosum FD-172 SS1]|uniref:DUF6532 domain-containing protein n=1 Tax=Botryobasidium botryosum (strain FD-172 SS1) TaxID=930990 RepID=A0A067LVZ7_BOTB1|nr:hypothetical protein BOTBODRAFT_181603 [Botryobasidium botryosum FD-172 SS1]